MCANPEKENVKEKEELGGKVKILIDERAGFSMRRDDE